MISSSHLNKLIYFTFFIFILILNSSACLATEDIWKNKDKKKDQSIKADEENKITIENSILSEDINKITVKIDENKIEDSQESVMGIFDPEENNFNLNMWFDSDGNDIKMDAFGHVRLDEINPGQWYSKKLGHKLKADKVLIQKSGYFSRSASPNDKDLDLIKKSADFAVECAIN